MKKSKFSESQIIKILSQQESGQSVTDICKLVDSKLLQEEHLDDFLKIIEKFPINI